MLNPDSKHAVPGRPRARPGEASVHLDTESVRQLAAPAEGSRIVLDDQIPGFCCQITYTGTKTFRLRYRRGGKWYSVKLGRWRDSSAPQAYARTDAERKKRGITAGDARKAAAEIRRAIDRGENPALEAKLKEAEQVRSERGAVPVKEAFREYREWIANRPNPLKPASVLKVDVNFSNHILPRLGARYLASLTPEDVRIMAAEVSKPKKVGGRRSGGPRAANHAVAQLSAFLAWAVKRELISDNVAKRIDRKRDLAPETSRERYLTREEWAAVMHELDEMPFWANRGSRYAATKLVRTETPQLRQLVSCEALRVAMLTGARKGEVFRMRWEDVDLDAGWWVKPRETMKGGKEHEIALPQMAIDSLRKLRAAHPDPVFVFPGKARLDAITSGKRLKGDEGGHIQDVSELWGKVRDKLGIPEVRIHDLRHTAASVLISSGASLYEVGQQLGHSQAQTTQRYAHLFEEAKRRTASRMDTFAAESGSKPITGGTTPAKRPTRVR